MNNNSKDVFLQYSNSCESIHLYELKNVFDIEKNYLDFQLCIIGLKLLLIFSQSNIELNCKKSKKFLKLLDRSLKYPRNKS